MEEEAVKNSLYYVTLPWCAGGVEVNKAGRIAFAMPILQSFMGVTFTKFKAFVQRNGGTIQAV